MTAFTRAKLDRAYIIIIIISSLYDPIYIGKIEINKCININIQCYLHEVLLVSFSFFFFLVYTNSIAG